MIKNKQKYLHKIMISLLTLFLMLTVIWILFSAGQYYITPKIDRPHVLVHKLWKPGGIIGHGLGIAGSMAIIIMFVYSIRKRVRIFRKWGRLRTWLNYHIFLGIAGPILVTFHTAFKFGGLISISFWSMIAVASSGFIGRYIYTKIPRKVSGKEYTRKEIENNHQEIKNELRTTFFLSDEALENLNLLSGADKIEKKGLKGLFTFLSFDLTGWQKRKKIIFELAELTQINRSQFSVFENLIKQDIKISREIAFLNSARELFHYWHVIHKPFAYAMILIMIVHIITAVTFGYTWIF